MVVFAGGMLLGAGLGLFNGVLVWRIRISPLIITLATLTLYLGLALLVTGGGQSGAVFNLPESFESVGRARLLGLAIPVWVYLTMLLLAHIILSRTTIGRHIYAIGGNREAAEIAGIPVRRFVIGVFVVSGILVSIAAMLATSRFGAADVRFGINLGLDAITATILGGVAFKGGEGNLVGPALAVALIIMMNGAWVAFGLNPSLNEVAKGMLLLLAVGLDQFAHDQRERHRTLVALREHRRGEPQEA